MHEASTCVFRVGVLSSVIQACKPDAKIAQLCEQGDKLIQEYVITCFVAATLFLDAGLQ